MFWILSIDFVRNAFLIGTTIAIISAVVGYFVVLRSASFAAHSLAHIGFAGATGAVLVGVNPMYGLLAFTTIAGMVMGYLGDKLRGRDVVIGMVLSFALGLGALFLTLYTKYATQAFSILFGTIYGVSASDVVQTALLSLLCLLVILYIYHPLLFSSIDAQVAQSKGIHTRLLSIVFFVVLAVTVSIAVQVVGVLLIFTLIIGPAATAQYLTSSPVKTVLLSILISLFEVWIAIILSYYIAWPVSFFIATISFVLYLTARMYNAANA